MRSRPIGTPLSDEEAATVARFEAAPDAEESFRERLIDALHLSLDSLGLSEQVSARASQYLADAAIAVMRGIS